MTSRTALGRRHSGSPGGRRPAPPGRHRPGRPPGQPPEHRQIHQVVPHEADLRAAPDRARRAGPGTARLSRPIPGATCAILSSAARRSTASARRPERIADRLPRDARANMPTRPGRGNASSPRPGRRRRSHRRSGRRRRRRPAARSPAHRSARSAGPACPIPITPRIRRGPGRSGRSRRSGRRADCPGRRPGAR